MTEAKSITEVDNTRNKILACIPFIQQKNKIDHQTKLHAQINKLTLKLTEQKHCHTATFNQLRLNLEEARDIKKGIYWHPIETCKTRNGIMAKTIIRDARDIRDHVDENNWHDSYALMGLNSLEVAIKVFNSKKGVAAFPADTRKALVQLYQTYLLKIREVEQSGILSTYSIIEQYLALFKSLNRAIFIKLQRGINDLDEDTLKRKRFKVGVNHHIPSMATWSSIQCHGFATKEFLCFETPMLQNNDGSHKLIPTQNTKEFGLPPRNWQMHVSGELAIDRNDSLVLRDQLHLSHSGALVKLNGHTKWSRMAPNTSIVKESIKLVKTIIKPYRKRPYSSMTICTAMSNNALGDGNCKHSRKGTKRAVIALGGRGGKTESLFWYKFLKWGWRFLVASVAALSVAGVIAGFITPLCIPALAVTGLYFLYHAKRETALEILKHKTKKIISTNKSIKEDKEDPARLNSLNYSNYPVSSHAAGTHIAGRNPITTSSVDIVIEKVEKHKEVKENKEGDDASEEAKLLNQEQQDLLSHDPGDQHRDKEYREKKLLAAVKAFKDIKSDNYGPLITHHNNKDLHTAALQSIILKLDDHHHYSHIACKSGKDRTFLIIIVINLFNKFYSYTNKFLPETEDELRLWKKIANTEMKIGYSQLAASLGGTQGCHGCIPDPAAIPDYFNANTIIKNYRLDAAIHRKGFPMSDRALTPMSHYEINQQLSPPKARSASKSSMFAQRRSSRHSDGIALGTHHQFR